MLHDTCEVSLDFGKNLTMRSFGDRHHVLAPYRTTSNIMAITALGVSQLRVRTYNTKIAAIYGEFRREVLRPFARDRVGELAPRQERGLRDIYGTGMNRTVHFYPDSKSTNTPTSRPGLARQKARMIACVVRMAGKISTAAAANACRPLHSLPPGFAETCVSLPPSESHPRAQPSEDLLIALRRRHSPSLRRSREGPAGRVQYKGYRM